MNHMLLNYVEKLNAMLKCTSGKECQTMHVNIFMFGYALKRKHEYLKYTLRRKRSW